MSMLVNVKDNPAESLVINNQRLTGTALLLHAGLRPNIIKWSGTVAVTFVLCCLL